jgi:thioredoxin-related protein
MFSMKNMLLVFLLLFSQSLWADAAPRDPQKFFFNDSFGDYPEELAAARAENKKGILLFFEQEECPYCHYMKIKVLNQPDVQDYYRKHFKIFAVDIEGDVEITDFDGQVMKMKDFSLKKNRVRATPVFVFYDLSGKQIHRHTGKTSGVEEFMLMGKFIAEDIYKDMRFTKYKLQQQSVNK